MNATATEGEVRKDFEWFKNPFGLVDDQTAIFKSNSGNSLLFHSHYLWTLHRLGFYKWEDGTDFHEIVVTKLQVQSGLYLRSPRGLPFWQDIEQMDDYLGMISVCAFDGGLDFARAFLVYGRTTWVKLSTAYPKDMAPWWMKFVGWVKVPFVFNAQMPGKFINRDGTGPEWVAWFGRFLALIACAKLVAGEKLSLINKLSLAGTLYLTARFKNNQKEDPWILSEKVASIIEAKNFKWWLTSIALRDFKKRLFEKWPEGMTAIFARYFGEKHAITRYYVTSR